MSVYFARVGQYIKVGYSRTPERRVANLFSSATRYSRPTDLEADAPRELLATIPGGLGVERMCHSMLGDFAAGGEFFIDESPVRSFITEATAGRFTRPVRSGGPFEPVSDVTDEQQAHLLTVLDHIFDARASAP